MFKILFGFEDSKLAVNNILKELKSFGIPYETEVKYSKVTIKDFLLTHPDYNVVILKETVGGSKYTAEELAELADEREINIIVVLSSEHKGQPYMQTLYSAGIVNAIFQEGRGGGGTAAGIVKLMLQKRSRKEARAYYGIDTVDVGVLPNETFAYYYRMLENTEFGVYLIERYLFLASKLSPLQNADFLRRLPRLKVDELSNFSEFHQVLSAIKGVGVDIAKELKIKKPKKFITIDSLPKMSPLLEERSEQALSGLLEYDGTEDADSGVFDFGIGAMLANYDRPGSTEPMVSADINKDTIKRSDIIEKPLADAILPAQEDTLQDSVVENTTERTAGVVSKSKRVKGDKIKKNKARKQPKADKGVVEAEDIRSDIPSLEESTRKKRSFGWLLWAIPLALILIVTITLITILVIYYIRY